MNIMKSAETPLLMGVSVDFSYVEAIKAFGWKDVFDTHNIVGCYSLSNKRASKDGGDSSLFLKALEVMGVKPNECIAFGNEVSDTLAAQNAGIEAYNCLWGAEGRDREIMMGEMASQTLKSPSEIIENI